MFRALMLVGAAQAWVVPVARPRGLLRGGALKVPAARTRGPQMKASKDQTKKKFQEALRLPALQVPARRVGVLQKLPDFKKLVFRRRGVHSISPVEGDSLSRRVLLKRGTDAATLPDIAQTLLSCGEARLAEYDLQLDYSHFSAEEALHKLLPHGVEIPRSFETVGHLAHFNLRDALWDHRFVIGQVILDKNPSIHTVVTKVGSLTNEFRTFDMEIIAGRNDTNVEVVERGIKLQFDFRQVYWNSRLSEERRLVLEMLSPEDVVVDLFAGVGAFALQCAARGCRVYANDLNPAAAEAIKRNMALNRLNLEISCLDARECVATLARERKLLPRHAPLDCQTGDPSACQAKALLPGTARVHLMMNLPELALDFLDALRGMVEAGRSELFSESPIELFVHCYCFARGGEEPPEAEIHPRIKAALGVVPADVLLRQVRDVAPNKSMYCAEFVAHLHPLGKSGPGTLVEASAVEAEAGREVSLDDDSSAKWPRLQEEPEPP